MSKVEFFIFFCLLLYNERDKNLANLVYIENNIKLNFLY